jgi:hypothetical protein
VDGGVAKTGETKRYFLLLEKTSICLQYAVRHHPKHARHMFVRVACTVRSESRCALTKRVGTELHERLYIPEPQLNWIKQLNTLPVLHFNLCLTAEYSETTPRFNSNFDANNRIYVP